MARGFGIVMMGVVVLGGGAFVLITGVDGVVGAFTGRAQVFSPERRVFFPARVRTEQGAEGGLLRRGAEGEPFSTSISEGAAHHFGGGSASFFHPRTSGPRGRCISYRGAQHIIFPRAAHHFLEGSASFFHGHHITVSEVGGNLRHRRMSGVCRALNCVRGVPLTLSSYACSLV